MRTKKKCFELIENRILKIQGATSFIYFCIPIKENKGSRSRNRHEVRPRVYKTIICLRVTYNSKIWTLKYKKD